MANVKRKKLRRPPLNPSDMVVEINLGKKDFPPLPSKPMEASENDSDKGMDVPPTPVNLETSSSKASFVAVTQGSIPSQGLKLSFMESKDRKARMEPRDCLNLEKQWGYALIGYVGGRFPGIKSLREAAAKWKARVKLHLHPSGWIIFKFQTEEERSKVVNGGPYHIFGRPLLLKEMPREFNFGDELIHQVPIWVQLPNLPIDYWTSAGLSKIGSLIGKPISSDLLTQTREHLAYARIMVEIDISSDRELLPPFITLINTTGQEYVQKVTYEYIPYYCDLCNGVGHNKSHCSMNTDEKTCPAQREMKAGRKEDSEIIGIITGKMEGENGRIGPAQADKPVRRKILDENTGAGAGEQLVGVDDRQPESVSHHGMQAGPHQVQGHQPTSPILGKKDSQPTLPADPALPNQTLVNVSTSDEVKLAQNGHAEEEIRPSTLHASTKEASAMFDAAICAQQADKPHQALAGTSKFSKNPKSSSGSPPLMIPSETYLGQGDKKIMGQTYLGQSNSDSSVQSLSIVACKPRAQAYSPLKVNRFLSPPRTRRTQKRARNATKRSSRALSLPKPKACTLIDEDTDGDEIADTLVNAFNGPAGDAQSDKEILEDEVRDRGRSKNRFLPLKSPKLKG